MSLRQSVLNMEAVLPIPVDKERDIITRTIVPAVSMPPLYSGDERTNGIVDTVFTACWSSTSRYGRRCS